MAANRKYNMDDAHLVLTAKAKIAFMQRDIAALSDYGITPAVLTAFENLVNDFENFATDIELHGAQELATEEKKAKAELVRDTLTDLRSRVQNKFGTGTPAYKLFGFEGLTRWDYANLLYGGRRIAHICLLYLADLAEYGLTNAHLLQLKNLCDALEDLMIVQDMKTGERTITQSNRVVLGNRVFDEMSRKSKLAKSAWRTKDAAKYNDYIIYDGVAGAGEVVDGSTP